MLFGLDFFRRLYRKRLEKIKSEEYARRTIPQVVKAEKKFERQ